MNRSHANLLLAIAASALSAHFGVAAETNTAPVQLTPPPAVGGAAAAASQAPGREQSPTEQALNDVVTNPAKPTAAQTPADPKQFAMSSSPQIGANNAPADQEPTKTVLSPARKTRDVTELTARVFESRYPETVRRQGSGYVAVNVPPGWKMVQIRSMEYKPAPKVQLANNEEYAIQCAPFVLVPASDATRVPINPRGLQVIHNFYLAQEEVMRQFEEAMKATNVVTPVD